MLEVDAISRNFEVDSEGTDEADIPVELGEGFSSTLRIVMSYVRSGADID